jgi:hypothetical protein
MANYEDATYHIAQFGRGPTETTPTISILTAWEALESLQSAQDEQEVIVNYGNYLGLGTEFRFADEGFGYAGTGEILETDQHNPDDWVELRLPIADPETGAVIRSRKQIMPIVATIGVVLDKLLRNPPESRAVYPQLITTTISNDPDQAYNGARLDSVISPSAIELILGLDEAARGEVEGRIQEALYSCYPQWGNIPHEKDEFGAFVGQEVGKMRSLRFQYPGDGSSYSGNLLEEAPTRYFASNQLDRIPGLRINVANPDYPEIQLSVLGGLGALSVALLEKSTEKYFQTEQPPNQDP